MSYRLILWAKKIVVLTCSLIFSWHIQRKYQRYRQCSLFDYQDYVQDVVLPKRYVNFSLLIYGIRRILAKKLKISFLGTEIEHGVYFGKHVNLKYNDLIDNVITLNKERAEILKNSLYDVNVVGPYIHYADGVLSENALREIRNQLGRTLLVFPVHSIPSIIANFNLDEFISWVKIIGVDYKTVIVCMYYQDIYNGLDQEYLKHGFQVVSAGHRFDPFFMDRLKSIFDLADNVVTNGIGTHVGYAVYLNKPIIALHQKINYDGLFEERSASGNGIMHEKWQAEYVRINKEFYKFFVRDEFIITAEQLAFCGDYWGYSHIRPENIN